MTRGDVKNAREVGVQKAMEPSSRKITTRKRTCVRMQVA